ncbi:hypothetical protein [Actinokineospora cianjurensis]|uniref:hypothetical protein n=1 Tax=Actinokineospora cianjurensis TaxID=585224 RepID=UPI0014771B45|nr:hypothetical protein [Actinokineospora cianjurensis]
MLVPAAIGGLIDHDTEIAADLVVGPANNQLVTDDVADTLADKGITWIPDFVASAGGIFYTVAREVDRLPHDAALVEVDRIADTVRAILDTDTTPLDAANTPVALRMAEPGHHR